MGCAGSKQPGVADKPMSGDDRVGKQRGETVTRDEARARAAAAAEARAAAAPKGGGSSNALRAPTSSSGNDGKVDISDPRAWD
jgi:hypothetical protein